MAMFSNNASLVQVSGTLINKWANSFFKMAAPYNELQAFNTNSKLSHSNGNGVVTNLCGSTEQVQVSRI